MSGSKEYSLSFSNKQLHNLYLLETLLNDNIDDYTNEVLRFTTEEHVLAESQNQSSPHPQSIPMSLNKAVPLPQTQDADAGQDASKSDPSHKI
ncbi:hypothetical protein HAX54_049967, partial [Datura stramonium]|nr:hypothetical protein [Datura stramonium]